MKARNIPLGYPLKEIEKSVDYGVVNIAGRDLVLPVRATNMVCHGTLTRCARNETEFHKYRQFTAESVVTTTDSAWNPAPPRPRDRTRSSTVPDESRYLPRSGVVRRLGSQTEAPFR
jgi:hypothetical protein